MYLMHCNYNSKNEECEGCPHRYPHEPTEECFESVDCPVAWDTDEIPYCEPSKGPEGVTANDFHLYTPKGGK